MELRICKSHGLRNDLVVEIPRHEIDDVRFHIANREQLMTLPGLARDAPELHSDSLKVADCKVPIEVHLSSLGLISQDGHPLRRAIAVGCRNVGNNHGYIAWQADQTPRLFHVRGEPFAYASYSCIVKDKSNELGVRQLTLDRSADAIAEQGADMSERIHWAVFANQVLRGGLPVDIGEIIDQFYDIQHVLAFDRRHETGRELSRRLYQGYPTDFRSNALHAWSDLGTPRNRYLHNAIGFSDDAVYILQREGTIEEIANWLRQLGVIDGFILDNGGSPACWVWWPYPTGGFVFNAPDYRPNATAVLVFVLKGPASTRLPGGSVSFTVL